MINQAFRQSPIAYRLSLIANLPTFLSLRSVWLFWFLTFQAICIVACSTLDDQTPRQPATAAKIFIAEDGMYELTTADLEAAGLGWIDSDSVQFCLFYRGRPQPLWVDGRGKTLSLRFYGQANQSRYAPENVYWLQREQRRGCGSFPGPSGSSSSSVPVHGLVDRSIATVRAEENQLYLPQMGKGDHWFWVKLSAPQTQTFDVGLTAVAPGQGRLRVEVWASTQGAVAPDHHLRISVNGQPVADETWDGQGHHTIEADLPARLLKEGANVVSIEAPGDTGVPADIVFVDWIEVRYPRFLVAEADRLAFESRGGRLRLTGFGRPAALFDITDPQNVARLTGVQVDQPQDPTVVTFEGEPGRRYLAVGPTGFQRPVRIAPAVTSPGLRMAGVGADYVAIGPPDLLEPLQPLLKWRESQGLKVMAVPIEAIYDQFNHGLPEPEAIRAFLKYAAQSWQPAPQYLLLVGDTTYDPRGYVTPPAANRVPSFLIPTVFGGETASDTVLVQLNADPWPDMAVGRMPARDPGQVHSLVEKVLAYEQRLSDGPWRRRVLAVADGQAPAFYADAKVFLERFPATYETVLLAPEAGAADASRQVKRRLDAGNLLVAYFGHGSVTQWGKDRLFTVDDGAALTNGDHLPVVLNMTCLTGLFTHPGVDSLAETLLWQPAGGAIAVLAPTSLTLAADQSFLSQALMEAFLEDPTATLGQILLHAWRRVPADNPSTRDVMQTFLLFGDPAMRLADSRGQ
jgi:hypothetical protein